MKRIGLRRALSAFVVVTAIVGVMMVGLVGQASAVSGVEPVAGAQKSANPNKDITAPVTTDVGVGQTVIISVATGTFAGNVSCSDSEGNVYNVRADRNGGSGRLFVCESQLTTALGTSDTVKATYPGFSGTSVLSAIGVDQSLICCGYEGPTVTSAGSNPPVSTATVNQNDTFVFGVVANTNVSNFVPDAGWTVTNPQSAGTGAGRRTVTPVWQDVVPGDVTLTGHLTGSGFWQAAMVLFTT